MFAQPHPRRMGPAIALTVLLAAVAASPAPAATVYAGSTSRTQDPLVVQIAKSRIVGMALMWRASCQSGRGYSFGETIKPSKPIPIRRGRFSGTLLVPQDLGADGTALASVIVSGTVTKTKLRGSFTGALAVGSDPSGPSDTCVVTDEHFSLAHRPGRVFGGSTSQGLPAVLELNTKGTKVPHFHIGWQANCNGNSSLQYGDFLMNFAIKRGRFGDIWSHDVTDTDGSTAGFDYTVSGRITRSASKGSISVTITFQDPAGAITDMCSTASVTFKAFS